MHGAPRAQQQPTRVENSAPPTSALAFSSCSRVDA
eukprot:COSAG04_NODE_26330_length_296_cov_0.771574_1_plen_34_part_10